MRRKKESNTFAILFVVFSVSFFLYHIIFSQFFSTDENNYLIAPDWYIPVGLSVSVILTIPAFFIKRFITASFGERRIVHNNFRALSAQQTMLHVDCMEGHQFEYWCADLLSHLGFYNVVVTRGSGDQGVDVLATRDGIKYAIQCKCYSSDLGNTPVQEIYTGKTIYGCQVGAVMTNVRFTAGGRQAAQATGVLLWDRDWIINALASLNPAVTGQKNYSQDPLFFKVADFAVRWRVTGTKALCMVFKIGYARTARIIDDLERAGIIGPFQGSIARDVLVDVNQWNYLKQQMGYNEDSM